MRLKEFGAPQHFLATLPLPKVSNFGVITLQFDLKLKLVFVFENYYLKSVRHLNNSLPVWSCFLSLLTYIVWNFTILSFSIILQNTGHKILFKNANFEKKKVIAVTLSENILRSCYIAPIRTASIWVASIFVTVTLTKSFIFAVLNQQNLLRWVPVLAGRRRIAMC